ncbi:MAG: flippase-like domain-containing protein [Solirubrobacterales bacterium]|nr:flippase-like domain-containing protein [Solirubrobacterales bacterium]MCB8915928.1 flippase-like domain-containing protein [Thermoleophilales bacterium]
MRIALVTPYSWTYQGGVNRHVQSLAEEYISRGHYVRVIAPFDPPDRLSKVLHRAPAEDREIPDYLIPVGRTFGINANGAVSNIPLFPSGVVETRRAIEQGNFDVVHLHEPTTPANGWDTCLSSDVPVVGTFHAYSTKPLPNYIANVVGARRTLNHLSARIAVSQAAAWTGRRWFGGNYTIVPNGVDIDAAPRGPKPETDHLRALFVGRPDERKGLPVLLRAFSALVDHVPARLSVVGAEPEDVQRILAHPELADHLDLHGRVSNDELWQQLHEADVLVAPSLSGESFGMILTEAFAAGTPVIASGIAGYSDVVTNNYDGILVPPADPQALAEELQRAHHEPERLARMGVAARESSKRYAWSSVADQVMNVYERAIEVPGPEDATDRIRRRIGVAPSDGLPWTPAVKLPSLDPAPATGAGGRKSWIRKAALGAVALLGLGLTAMALQRIDLNQVADAVVRSDLSWVLIALALMASSLFVRAWSWFFITKSAMPHSGLKRRDFASATMIGVLMSATLPARLGEPARAISLARHTGRAKETLPVVVGTIVSQTMFNILAILLLGAFVLSSMDNLFHSATKQILLFSLIPAGLLLAVVIAPTILGNQNGEGRLARIGAAIHSVMVQVRSGLTVFKHPRYGLPAVALQLFAWVIQLLSCWALMFALGLDNQAGLAASAAVLLAVNVTAVVPATPSNIGVFQLAVIFVLHKGWGISTYDALAYGVILQAVEMATAAALGVPALLREGLTWSDLRTQAIASAPVELDPYPQSRRTSEKREVTYTR